MNGGGNHPQHTDYVVLQCASFVIALLAILVLFNVQPPPPPPRRGPDPRS